MAQIPNSRADTVGDGLNDYFNVNTVLQHVQLLNGAILRFFSDAYTTRTMDLGTNGTLSLAQSATAPALANAGTIATTAGVARVSPASAVTGIILAAGTLAGQLCLVINEAVLANSVTFDVSGTSNVADGVQDVIPGLIARLYVWDSVAALWFPVGSLTLGSSLGSTQSATAVAIAANGQIATAGLAVSRLNPGASRTGITMQAGTYPGQMVTVVNEAVAAVTLTFNTTPGTSNVADSATESNIPGLTARTFVWDSAQSLWYRCN